MREKTQWGGPVNVAVWQRQHRIECELNEH
jgi:hypothetical protein